MTFAPVVLFVYNRPDHTRRTIDALKLNRGALETDLLVYSDAPKTPEHQEMVLETREVVGQITGFKSVTVRERPENWGLAASIIDGVTKVVEDYGRVIVLEDDIVTSPSFLSFMNKALDFYQDNRSVWHISGWNYPVDPSGLGDAFLWRAMNCWGWATWADRWRYFEKNPEKLIEDWSSEDKKSFDMDGSGVFWGQIEANSKGKINTWAVFWYATIFQNKGLCLNPSISYVENIGHDGTGEHCGVDNTHSIKTLNSLDTLRFPPDIFESKVAVSRIKEFYKFQKKSFPVRAMNKISRIVIGKSFL